MTTVMITVSIIRIAIIMALIFRDDAYVDTNNDNDDADGHGCGGGFLQGLTSFFIRNSAVAAFR